MRAANALLAISATALIAGCGSSAKPTTSPTTATTVVSTTSTTFVTGTTATTGGASTTTATTQPGVGHCVAALLSGSFRIIPGSAGAGHVEARVVLTNISSAPCTTFGYAGMQLLGASDSPLPTNVVRVPGSEPHITLAPGSSASALARFSPDIPGLGDSASGACQPVAQGTEITPPNDTHFLIAPGLNSSVCSRGTIDLNPLVPGATAGP